jgi:replicative DNA helicase
MPDIDEYLTRLDNLRPNTPDEICTAAEAIAAYRLQKVNPAQTHSTGIDGLNRVLRGGCRDGQLVVIGGRPGTGKSVLMLQFAVAAATIDKSALVVSLEMPRQEIAGRLAARFGESRVAELPVNFLDTTSNLDAIAALVKVQHRRKPLGMLVVDYLQLLDVKGNRQDTRQDRIAAASRTLKRLAMDLQIPVIAGSQLNRDSEKRGKPTMADLRESGAIEQDADVVILISVDRDSGESELDVCKHRGGATGRVSVELDGPRFQFSEKIPSWVGAEEKWG